MADPKPNDPPAIDISPNYKLTQGPGFTTLQHKDFNAELHYTPSPGEGWKFHLSVHPDDTPRAFEILKPMLMEDKVGAAKMANEHLALKFHNPAYKQSGKQITIYGPGDASWHNFIRETEIAFREAGIRPSVAVKGDRAVPGSAYASYRHEVASDALDEVRLAKFRQRDAPRYLSADEIRDDLIVRGKVPSDMAHNPSQVPDSLKHINFANDPAVQRAGLPPAHDYHVEIGEAPPSPRPKALEMPHYQPHQPKSASAIPPVEKTSAPDLDHGPIPKPRTTRDIHLVRPQGSISEGPLAEKPTHAPRDVEPVTERSGPPQMTASEPPAAAALPDTVPKASPGASKSIPINDVSPSAVGEGTVTVERSLAPLARDGAAVSRLGSLGAAAAPAAIGAVLSGGVALSEGKPAGEIAKAFGAGALNGAFGVDDFKTSLNTEARPADRILGGFKSATAALTTASAAAAPVTGGVSLVVAGYAGIANLSLGVIQDVAHVFGLADDKGLLESSYNLVTGTGKPPGPGMLADRAMERALLPLNSVARTLARDVDVQARASEPTQRAIQQFRSMADQEATTRVEHASHFAKQLATELRATGPSGDAVRYALEPALKKVSASPEQYAAVLDSYAGELDKADRSLKNTTRENYIPAVKESADHLQKLISAGAAAPAPTGFDLPADGRPNRYALRQEHVVAIDKAEVQLAQKDSQKDASKDAQKDSRHDTGLSAKISPIVAA